MYINTKRKKVNEIKEAINFTIFSIVIMIALYLYMIVTY